MPSTCSCVNAVWLVYVWMYPGSGMRWCGRTVAGGASYWCGLTAVGGTYVV